MCMCVLCTYAHLFHMHTLFHYKQIKSSVEHIQIHYEISIEYTWFAFAIACSHESAGENACNLCLYSRLITQTCGTSQALVRADSHEQLHAEPCIFNETIAYKYRYCGINSFVSCHVFVCICAYNILIGCMINSIRFVLKLNRLEN